jgi:hypothetical protein
MSSQRGGVPSSRAETAHTLLPSLASLGVGAGEGEGQSETQQRLDEDLVAAVYGGRDDAVRTLLSKGADVDVRDDEGFTPLHYACWRRHVVIARLLLMAGADTNVVVPSKGWTPLHLACLHVNVECVQLLLDAGVEVDARDSTGQTPLHWACDHEHGSPACVRLLLRYGADWRERVHVLFGDVERAAVERALRALLLAEARRAGCALGWAAAERILRAVVPL